MLAQDVFPIGFALGPVLGSFIAETIDILDDGRMSAERGKGYVGLEKGRLTLVKCLKHFRGVLRITYKGLS